MIGQTWFPQAFLDEVIDPALKALELNTSNRRQMLLGTAIQESRIRDIKQIKGPALGPLQMEPETHDDIWFNYIEYRKDLRAKLAALLPVGAVPSKGPPSHDFLLGHPIYAAAMAAVHYERAEGMVPEGLEAQASYYKLHYNTVKGAATVQQYIDNYKDALAAHPLTHDQAEV